MTIQPPYPVYQLPAFAILSAALIYLSRASLRTPRSHGFFRFFAWEAILALVLLQLETWFQNPLSWHQLASWFLLTISILLLVSGVRTLAARGNPAKSRDTEPHLLGIEKTTTLVTTGIYRYIRHPLYSSLLFLAWGTFLKAPAWPGALLAAAATLFLFATARAEEAECLRFFGPPYKAYMKRTRRFIPFLF